MAKSSVSAWLPVILADFAGTPVADFDVRLIDFDPAQPGDLAGLDPKSEASIRATWHAHQRLLMVAAPDGSTDLMDFDWLAGDPEGLAVEIASTRQDHVMDRLNTTWPDVVVDGRTVVLEPRLGPDGMPRWEGRGVEPCPFGQLAGRLAQVAGSRQRRAARRRVRRRMTPPLGGAGRSTRPRSRSPGPSLGGRDHDVEIPERLFARKYSGMQHDGHHGWLRLTPDKITSWDFRKTRGATRWTSFVPMPYRR